MAGIFKGFFKYIDIINERIGNAFCFLILIIMVLVGASTISRYFFNKPFTFMWPLIKQVFGAFVLFGGAYALLYDRHIKVEIFYIIFPPWAKKASHIITLIFLMAFLGALTWQGILMAKFSFMLKEVSSYSSRLPIYPFKIFLPFVVFLFLLQGISCFMRKKKKPDGNSESGDERDKCP